MTDASVLIALGLRLDRGHSHETFSTILRVTSILRSGFHLQPCIGWSEKILGIMKVPATVQVLFGVILASVLVSVRGITVDEYEILVREPPSQHSEDSYDLFGYTAVLHNRIDPSIAPTPFNDIVNNAR